MGWTTSWQPVIFQERERNSFPELAAPHGLTFRELCHRRLRPYLCRRFFAGRCGGRARFVVEHAANPTVQLPENCFYTFRGIHHFKAVLLGQPVKLRPERTLIFAEALMHVLAGMKVHAQI